MKLTFVYKNGGVEEYTDVAAWAPWTRLIAIVDRGEPWDTTIDREKRKLGPQHFINIDALARWTQEDDELDQADRDREGNPFMRFEPAGPAQEA